MLTKLRQRRAERKAEQRRKHRRCPRCGFAYLMEWTKTVTLIEPPEWWDLPWEWYHPEPFQVQVKFCTRCRHQEEVPIDYTVGDMYPPNPYAGDVA